MSKSSVELIENVNEFAPETVTALLAYDVHKEIVNLEKQVAELQKDAQRYSFLKSRALMFYPSAEGCENKDAYLVITGYGDDEEKIDEAIDSEIAIARERAK